MISLLIVTLLFTQGARLQPGTGIVTGSVRAIGGGSAAGVRVGAIAIDDPTGSTLAGVTETDSAGNFRLTNIPEGKYYIVAGRLDSLTYYPGGNEKSKASQVAVEPAKLTAIENFTVPADSKRPESSALNNGFYTALNDTEGIAYRQLKAERNPVNKTKLMLSFEKSYPKSQQLPEILVSLSQSYVAQSDLEKARQYAEKAVAAVSKMKDITASSLTTAAWQNWIVTLDAGAKSNLDWVKQMIAWQQKQLQSILVRRR